MLGLIRVSDMAEARLARAARETFSSLRRAPRLPLIIVLGFVLTAALAPVIAPHSPNDVSLADKLKPPVLFGGTWSYPLGTDTLGRDILSRLIFGARVSLTVSVLAILVGGAAGMALGLVSGYYGGWVDRIIMRLTDSMLSLPQILVAMLFAVVFGPSFTVVVLVIAFLIWPRYARQVRGETLTLRERDFVALARVADCTGARIMVRHIAPNVMNTILVIATLQVGMVIMLEASLGFLGVGVPPPTSTWGGMVADGRSMIASAWWISLVPGAAIALVVLSMNMLGDWLRTALDPALRQI